MAVLLQVPARDAVCRDLPVRRDRQENRVNQGAMERLDVQAIQDDRHENRVNRSLHRPANPVPLVHRDHQDHRDQWEIQDRRDHPDKLDQMDQWDSQARKVHLVLWAQWDLPDNLVNQVWMHPMNHSSQANLDLQVIKDRRDRLVQQEGQEKMDHQVRQDPKDNLVQMGSQAKMDCPDHRAHLDKQVLLAKRVFVPNIALLTAVFSSKMAHDVNSYRFL